MPCYNPTRVIMGGDHRIQFDKDWKWAALFDGETRVNLPCRRCIGCNMATQREWSVRAFHEAQLHTTHFVDQDTRITTEIPNSSVVTLTFDQSHLPADGCLDHRYFQRFMKRLRIRRQRQGSKDSIRYLMCGEYGGLTSRPHFHAILFGESFEDSYLEQSSDGQVNRMSYELDDLWAEKAPGDECVSKIGRATVDDFSFAGAAYVAGYVAKKQHALSQNWKHQGPVIVETDPVTKTTKIRPKAPEYRKMSNRPGLGADWIMNSENLARVYSKDEVRIGEWTFHPPKYYDLLLSRTRPDLVADIIANRREGMSKSAEDWSPERCSAAEQAALASLQQRRDSL